MDAQSRLVLALTKVRARQVNAGPAKNSDGLVPQSMTRQMLRERKTHLDRLKGTRSFNARHQNELHQTNRALYGMDSLVPSGHARITVTAHPDLDKVARDAGLVYDSMGDRGVLHGPPHRLNRVRLKFKNVGFESNMSQT